jgi:hypothetical protein
MKLHQFISVGMAVCFGTLASAQTNTVSNQTYPSGKPATIIAGPTVTTSGNVTVSNGANVTFLASASVALNPGFSAQPGSNFNATISAILPVPQVTLSPSATKTEPGQTVSFTVSGSCLSGIGQIGLESCDSSGNNNVNLGLVNPSGAPGFASHAFSWKASSVGTFYFDGYAWDGSLSQLTRTSPKGITVIDPTTTITSQSFGTPNYNDGVEVNFSITDGGVQTGGDLFYNTYEQGYDSNGNYYHVIIDQFSVLLTANGPGYVAWVTKDYYHGTNFPPPSRSDQYIYDVYMAVYNLSRKQWNVTEIGYFEGGPQSSVINGDFQNFKFDNLSPTQLTWQVDQFIYNANGVLVRSGTLNYTNNVTGQ